MWKLARSFSDIMGVGILATQLVKLIGFTIVLVGPVLWVTEFFEGLYPFIANLFNISLGLNINGLDIMSVSIALSGTLIVASSIATKEAMSTKYVFRFLMIPYAFLIIALAIFVQVITPFVELTSFNDDCSAGDTLASFYGSSCSDMAAQLSFFNGDTAASGAGQASGTGFILSMVYLVLILPVLAVLVFFFKRLSVNRMLRRVCVAAGSAIALVAASAAYAATVGDADAATLGEIHLSE